MQRLILLCPSHHSFPKEMSIGCLLLYCNSLLRGAERKSFMFDGHYEPQNSERHVYRSNEARSTKNSQDAPYGSNHLPTSNIELHSKRTTHSVIVKALRRRQSYWHHKTPTRTNGTHVLC
mmetsp:Transcript_21431/g.34837  ORF Transcript_21431/g.34837 Transcript_21431/m.34837 type:complete len:120 (-) Transcript_21431:492-851(-)